MSMKTPDPILKVDEVAAQLRVSKTMVYRLCSDGEIACYRIGRGRGAVRILESSVTRYLEGARTGKVTTSSHFR